MRKIITALLFTAVAAVPAMAQFPAQDDDAKYAVELLKPQTVAPNFKMKTVDGKTFQLNKLKAKYIVLDFWASWCPDCRKDIPNIKRMYDEFHKRGVEFVGISMDTDVEAWKKAIAKYDIAYTQVSELKKFHETAISKLYGVKWIPSMYLIKDGKIILGTVLSDKLEKTLTEQLAANKPIAGTKEDLWIEGSKGRLAATIQKPVLKDGEKCKMAIIMHGFGGDKESKLLTLISDSLQANGVASVRFDFNGHGKSEGNFTDMTVPNEIEDAKKVYEYVKALPYVSEVMLAGHSQGGVVASMTAGELGDAAISKVALLAPAAVLRDDAIRGNTFGASYDPLSPPDSVKLFGGRSLGKNYIKTAFSLPIYETAAKYQGKALIIHGTGDRVVPYTYGERYHNVWHKSSIEILPAFDHGFSQNVYRASNLAAQFLK